MINKMTLTTDLEPYSGDWGYAQAAHLLRRTGFGLKKSEVDALLAMDMETAVDKVLTVPGSLPYPPVNNYNNPDFIDPKVPLGQTWVNEPTEWAGEGYRIHSWRGWWFDLMLHQNTSILERMTLFWHNHFATEIRIVFWARSVYDYNQMLRSHALGNFKAFTKAVTKSGMMLLYLNGNSNKQLAPNENYARELQELFTIGKENGQPYSEDDVLSAARALTGWRVNFEDNSSFNSVFDHDKSEKPFSAFYNNTIIPGGLKGDAELDVLLDMIFEQPEVAVFICRKIYRWFVYYKIDDHTEQNVILPLAEIFRSHNYDIKPVMEVLLKSEHFFEAAQTGCFIKTPVDIVIGTLRTFNLSIPASTPWDQLLMHYILATYLEDMQMAPGAPPNVAGWAAFYQKPQYYRLWVTGVSLRNRNTFTDVLLTSFIETENDRLGINPIAFAQQFDDPGNPEALIADITVLLFPQPVSEPKKDFLKSILLSGLPTNQYWTAAWDSYTANPNDPLTEEVVSIRLRALLMHLMRLPEFQLG